MKYLSVILLSLALIVGCQPPGETDDGGTDSNTSAVDNQDATTLVKFSVPGITCEGCAASVQEALSGCQGVASVEVDATTKVATANTTADFDPQTALDTLAADQRFVSSSIIE